MSALGGILAFGGGRVDREQLTSLGTRLERLGPDGGRDVIAGPIGMTYRAFHTNAESQREHQPCCRGHLAMLCFDGRLDNRRELLVELRDDLRGDDTDAAIAMTAFLRWRREGLAKLVGDFALAIWDRRDRALWLARDCVGTRTLYYHVDRDRCSWSTDLGALLDVSRAPVEVNDKYVAGFLTRGPEPGLTPYAGIHAVKPAHAVGIDEAGCVSDARFWALDPHAEIRYRTDAEYEEHFREVFRCAVRVRLRSDRPVFAELSGGLDSSSIVCTADVLRMRELAPARPVETVSYVFDDCPSADERKWIDHVERHRGARGHHIHESEFRYLTPLRDDSPIRSLNSLLSTSAFDTAVRQILADCGARVLFSGYGGDHLLQSSNNPTPELLDLLVGCQFVRLHSSLRRWSSVVQRPYIQLLVRSAIVPEFRRRLNRVGYTPPGTRPPWLRLDFLRRVTGHESDRGIGFRRPSDRLQAQGFSGAVSNISTLNRQELGGVEIVFPYLDRRLVEFLQAIPQSQRLRPGQSRSIMRRALGADLPPLTAARKGKGNPAEVVFRGIARARGWLTPLFDCSRAADAGYVEPRAVQAALDRAAAGCELHTGSLMNTITLELWLRRVEGMRASANGCAALMGADPSLNAAAPVGATLLVRS